MIKFQNLSNPDLNYLKRSHLSKYFTGDCPYIEILANTSLLFQKKNLYNKQKMNFGSELKIYFLSFRNLFYFGKDIIY
jgi:hypothetical protein